VSFEFKIADFVDCFWDANLEWRMNCKIKTDFSQFIVFRVDAWAIDEDLEFSIKSRIEFARVNSKLDAFEFFFEIEKIEFDVLTKDSYDRNVKSNLENEWAFVEFSNSKEIEIKEEFEFRAFTIWSAIFVNVRVNEKKETERVNFELAKNWELIEFLNDSRECSFEKLNDKSTTFSKLIIVFLNSSRSIAHVCDQVMLFEDFEKRVFRDLSMIDEFLFFIIFKTKLLMSTNTRSSNLWFVRRKSRIEKLIFLICSEMSSFIKSLINHSKSNAMLEKIVKISKTIKRRSSDNDVKWMKKWRKEKRWKEKMKRRRDFCRILMKF
jgi:hypothetical protein